MFVYFVATKGCKPKMLKIGKARNVDSRLAELQCACPFDLELRGTLRCAGEKNALVVEEALHHAFRDYRRRGEWFLHTLEVKYAVDSIVAKGITGTSSYFKSHIFEARACGAKALQDDEVNAARINNALDREFRAILG